MVIAAKVIALTYTIKVLTLVLMTGPFKPAKKMISLDSSVYMI